MEDEHSTGSLIFGGIMLLVFVVIGIVEFLREPSYPTVRRRISPDTLHGFSNGLLLGGVVVLIIAHGWAKMIAAVMMVAGMLCFAFSAPDPRPVNYIKPAKPPSSPPDQPSN